jgi:predicted ester cyclase
VQAVARREELLGWLGTWVEAHNRRDVERLKDLVDEALVWTDPALFGQAVEGPEQFRTFVELSFRAFPDLELSIAGEPFFGVDGNSLVLPWRLIGTFTGPLGRWSPPGHGAPPSLAPTGQRIDLRGLDLYELRGTRLRRASVHYDLIELIRQLGIMPSPDGRLMHAALQGQRLLAPWLRRRASRTGRP